MTTISFWVRELQVEVNGLLYPSSRWQTPLGAYASFVDVFLKALFHTT